MDQYLYNFIFLSMLWFRLRWNGRKDSARSSTTNKLAAIKIQLKLHSTWLRVVERVNTEPAACFRLSEREIYSHHLYWYRHASIS